jgi:metal-responsive CopG/Arc/MetJ family transcriptional regulator
MAERSKNILNGAKKAPESGMREEHRINLRLPLDEFQEIDRFREKEPVKVSRNVWIATAIREKLERTAEKFAVQGENDHA